MRRVDLIATARRRALGLVLAGVAAIPVGLLVTVLLGFLVVGVILGPLLVIGGLVAIPIGIWQYLSPTSEASLRRLGSTDAERRQVIAMLEQQIAAPTTAHVAMGKSTLSLPPGWIVVHGNELLVARAADVLWVYKSVTVRKRYGFTVGKTHAVIVHLRGAGKSEVPVGEADGPAVVAAIASVAPQAFAGYQDQIEALSSADLERHVAGRSGQVSLHAAPPFAMSTGGFTAGPSQATDRKKSWPWILGGLGLVIGGCVLSCVLFGGFAFFLDRRTAALAGACDGRPVPGALAFEPSADPPMFAMNRTSTGWAADYTLVPDGFTEADTTEQTALVVCVEPVERVVVEVCPGTIERARQRRRARLVVARTGRSLREAVVEGPEPPRCGASSASANGAGPGDAEWTAFLRGALQSTDP